jgi:thymidine kinase
MVGFLDITFGPMFSGKTTALLEKINNFITYSNIKKKKVRILIINSSLDTRKSGKNDLSTHMSSLERSLVRDNVESIRTEKLHDLDDEFLENFDYIGIDEAQFFEDLESFVNLWLKKDKYIQCSGLIADSDKNNFGHLNKLFCLADNIEHLKAYCVECNDYTKKAVFTKWINNDNKNSALVIGGSDNYVPVCGKHY